MLEEMFELLEAPLLRTLKPWQTDNKSKWCCAKQRFVSGE